MIIKVLKKTLPLFFLYIIILSLREKLKKKSILKKLLGPT